MATKTSRAPKVLFAVLHPGRFLDGTSNEAKSVNRMFFVIILYALGVTAAFGVVIALVSWLGMWTWLLATIPFGLWVRWLLEDD